MNWTGGGHAVSLSRAAVGLNLSHVAAPAGLSSGAEIRRDEFCVNPQYYPFFSSRAAKIFLAEVLAIREMAKKSIPKRVKPQRARRAQRLQRKNSRGEPVNVSPFSG